MSTAIRGFTGEYRWLSNFWPCLITAKNGLVFLSTEAAYQAAKLDPGRPDWAEQFAAFSHMTAPQAKAAGRRTRLRPDWDLVKDTVMLRVLRQKFADATLAAKLIATGDAHLEETNYWGDTYWGVCNGVGRNKLGTMLMHIRDTMPNVIRWAPGMVTPADLGPGDVFVFGSNRDGFHGAGTAGLAMRGVAANTWRDDPAFRRAMKAPPGHSDRVGLRAIYGQPAGLMTGTAGYGYGVVTVTRPGARRSVPLREIYEQLITLWHTAAEHSELTFTVTPLGVGYAGYTWAELDTEVWGPLQENLILPPNLRFVGRQDPPPVANS